MTRVIHVQHRLDVEHRAEKRRRTGHTPAALEMIQVVHREPVGQMQLVFLQPPGRFFNAAARLLLLRRMVDQQALAHGGAQAVHREEFVLRIFCAQVLEGDARGVECAGQPGRKTHIQHVEAVPRHFTRYFPECLHIDLAGGGHSPAAEHIVKVPGRKVCFLRVVPIAFFADGIGHGQYSNARLRHKLRRKVRGGIRQDLIFTHRCRSFMFAGKSVPSSLLGNPQAVYHKSPCFSRLNFPFSAAMPARMRS